jgi:hypothetical protein
MQGNYGVMDMMYKPQTNKSNTYKKKKNYNIDKKCIFAKLN